MFVVNPTTPAQLFHLLRRQVKLPFRRPLVVFTPKSLLRHPACRSPLDTFTENSFCEIIADITAPKKTGRVLFCSGKIYYELLQKRNESERDDIGIVRIEQLYPLREDKIDAVLKKLPMNLEICWVQEEPANGGAWAYIEPLLRRITGKEIRYIGRAAAAATAVGSHRLHNIDQKRLIEDALSE